MGLWQDIVKTRENMTDGRKLKDFISGEFNSMSGVKGFIEKLKEQVELNTKLQEGSQSYEGAKEEYEYKSKAYAAVADALSAKIAEPEFKYPTSILTATETFKVIDMALNGLDEPDSKITDAKDLQANVKKQIMTLARRSVEVDKNLSNTSEYSYASKSR